MSKTIVVIGASRGIGKELVLLLAQNPTHHIVAFSRNLSAMQKAFAPYPNVESYALDLEKEDVKSCIENAYNKIVKQIDVVLFNAGKLINRPFIELTSTDIHRSYQVNVLSAFACFQASLPYMTKSGGHIVSISSMGGFQGSVKFAGLSTYSTSKAALASLTELLAEEYKNTNIKFNCLALGAAQTEMLNEAFPGYEAPLSAAEMAQYIANFALNAHQWINGKIIPVSLSTP